MTYDEKEWAEKFEENYNVNYIDEWTVGIVVEVMLHEQNAPKFSGAGHITKKLKELVKLALSHQRTSILQDLLAIADQGEYEDLRREVTLYAEKNGVNLEKE